MLLALSVGFLVGLSLLPTSPRLKHYRTIAHILNYYMCFVFGAYCAWNKPPEEGRSILLLSLIVLVGMLPGIVITVHQQKEGKV